MISQIDISIRTHELKTADQIWEGIFSSSKYRCRNCVCNKTQKGLFQKKQYDIQNNEGIRLNGSEGHEEVCIKFSRTFAPIFRLFLELPSPLFI